MMQTLDLLDQLKQELTLVDQEKQVIKINENEDTKDILTCNICWDEVNEKQKLVIKNCNHYFHTNCLKQYVKIEVNL